MTSALADPFPRASKRNRAHQIWHYPVTLGTLNNKMSTAEANSVIYHGPNSIRGVARRKLDGFNSGDRDLIVDRQKQVWVAHWDEAMEPWVGFHHKDDPKGKPRWSHRNVSEMDTVEVKPLRSLYGGYRMNRIQDYLEYQIHTGTGSVFEQKFHPYLRTETCWDLIATFIFKHGGHPDQFMAMTMPSPSAATGFLRAAGQAGLMTGILYRGAQRKDVKFMVEHGKPTWVKCTATQMAGLDVAGVGVRRMGTIPSNATWLGCSVHDGQDKASANAIAKAGGHVGLWPR